MTGWRGSHWFQPMLVASLVFLAGCSHYWYKPDDASTSLQQFSQDHRACLEQAGTPVVNRPGYAVIDEQAFRRCLVVRGWMRREVPSNDVPAGYYRGYEERELVPVRIDEIPEQPRTPSSTATPTITPAKPLPPWAIRCREIYADPVARKRCAEVDANAPTAR